MHLVATYDPSYLNLDSPPGIWQRWRFSWGFIQCGEYFQSHEAAKGYMYILFLRVNRINYESYDNLKKSVSINFMQLCNY